LPCSPRTTEIAQHDLSSTGPHWLHVCMMHVRWTMRSLRHVNEKYVWVILILIMSCASMPEVDHVMLGAKGLYGFAWHVACRNCILSVWSGYAWVMKATACMIAMPNPLHV
jgi:hypothetical protein